MIILIKLIIAHFIGDFLLQPNSWVEDKEKTKLKSWKLYYHILIHGFLLLVLLWDFNYWLLILLIMVSHGIIDILKLYNQKEKTNSKWFFIDQFLHLIIILGLWCIFFKPEIQLESWYKNTSLWTYLAAILFLTFVSGIFIRELMSKWVNELDDKNNESLSNAGKYIGILERLFVFFFVVIGNLEGIGFLLAAKSIFRFGDLKDSKDRKLTEYILIGTLLSFAVAIAIGQLVLLLVN